MKKIILLPFLLLILVGCCNTQGCCVLCDLEDIDNSSEPNESISPVDYTRYDPVLMTREQLEASIELTTVRTMEKSAKLYITTDNIFINDKYKGFHIYDNSTPTNPTLIRFLKVPGSTDIAVKGNIFYVNQATDLITLEYNPTNNSVEEKNRIRNIYPKEYRDPDGRWVGYDSDKILVDWKLKQQ